MNIAPSLQVVNVKFFLILLLLLRFACPVSRAILIACPYLPTFSFEL